MTSVQEVCAKARLGLVDDILVVAGWTETPDGWEPPERYRTAVETLFGVGGFSRANAIKIATEADEFAAQ